jgi:hypothetical protein
LETVGVIASTLIKAFPQKASHAVSHFSEHPLKKFNMVEAAIPFGGISGGRLLDIVCNTGNNSVRAA